MDNLEFAKLCELYFEAAWAAHKLAVAVLEAHGARLAGVKEGPKRCKEEV